MVVSYLAKGPVKSAAHDVEDEQFLDAVLRALKGDEAVPSAMRG